MRRRAETLPPLSPLPTPQAPASGGDGGEDVRKEDGVGAGGGGPPSLLEELMGGLSNLPSFNPTDMLPAQLSQESGSVSASIGGIHYQGVVRGWGKGGSRGEGRGKGGDFSAAKRYRGMWGILQRMLRACNDERGEVWLAGLALSLGGGLG